MNIENYTVVSLSVCQHCPHFSALRMTSGYLNMAFRNSRAVGEVFSLFGPIGDNVCHLIVFKDYLLNTRIRNRILKTTNKRGELTISSAWITPEELKEMLIDNDSAILLNGSSCPFCVEHKVFSANSGDVQ